MGIPKGITLIEGGGYHGKSTLLNALELGVYNHIPGDGRECAEIFCGQRLTDKFLILCKLYKFCNSFALRLE